MSTIQRQSSTGVDLDGARDRDPGVVDEQVESVVRAPRRPPIASATNAARRHVPAVARHVARARLRAGRVDGVLEVGAGDVEQPERPAVARQQLAPWRARGRCAAPVMNARFAGKRRDSKVAGEAGVMPAMLAGRIARRNGRWPRRGQRATRSSVRKVHTAESLIEVAHLRNVLEARGHRLLRAQRRARRRDRRDSVRRVLARALGGPQRRRAARARD